MAKQNPRVLVTGFEPFPGAPVNPTEWLVGELRANPPLVEGAAAFRAEILPVDYATINEKLSEIGHAFHPDIAIHFGLAQECSGFRLERVARNSYAGARPDNSGRLPDAQSICAGPAIMPSRLPLEAIAKALADEGLPVEWSNDAGGYLCNMVMTLSLAHACNGFAPAMSGFVHVPLTGEGMSFDANGLLRGALATVRATVAAWKPGPEF